MGTCTPTFRDDSWNLSVGCVVQGWPSFLEGQQLRTPAELWQLRKVHLGRTQSLGGDPVWQGSRLERISPRAGEQGFGTGDHEQRREKQMVGFSAGVEGGIENKCLLSAWLWGKMGSLLVCGEGLVSYVPLFNTDKYLTTFVHLHKNPQSGVARLFQCKFTQQVTGLRGLVENSLEQICWLPWPFPKPLWYSSFCVALCSSDICSDYPLKSTAFVVSYEALVLSKDPLLNRTGTHSTQNNSGHQYPPAPTDRFSVPQVDLIVMLSTRN